MIDFPKSTCQEALARIIAMPAGAIVLILGGPDTGKTTFAAEAAAALSKAGRSVAVVDCDLGQSEIGPPGTIGVGWAAAERPAPLASLRDLSLVSAYFVGAISPVHHALDVCAGASAMLRVAKTQKPDVTIVDTCGWIEGLAARHFKRRLAELVLPQLVLNFSRLDAPNPLLEAFGHLKAPEALQVEAPATQRKSSVARATRRAARFLAALEGSQAITVSWDNIGLLGTRLGEATPIPHHGQQFLAQSLHVPVLHAERAGNGALYIIINGETWETANFPLIEGHFHTKAFTIVPARRFAGLLIGLIDSSGALLDIGLLSRIDFEKRTITVQTSCRRPAAIAQIWFGVVRLHRDGREKGVNRPGEI